MKKLRHLWSLAFLTALITAPIVRATVFTNNAAIGVFNTNFDGGDLVISNCTVTVDGPHSFASLLVADGGVLTHSFFANGSTTIVFNVTNEPVVLSSTNPATLLNTNVSAVLAVTDLGQTTIYTNGLDYVVAPQGDGTTQIQWTNTSSIADGATVLVSYSWNLVVPAGLNLTVNSSVTVASGGSINASSRGYGGGLGSGHGWPSIGGTVEGSGAGYGGNGGASSSDSPGPFVSGVGYGSVSQPANPGSGGGTSYAGSGGAGGGLIQIYAAGDMIIDGTIMANGANATNSRAGGGAGGGIWLSAEAVSGAGSITANGGAGEPVHGGGGGGGRIAIQSSANAFSGTMTAYGGAGWNGGGAGTIFTQITGQNGLLLMDNGGRAGTNSIVALPAATDVLIRSNALVVPSGVWSAGNLTIAANGTMLATAQSNLILNVSGALVIQPGGAISADGLGYAAGSGTGAGNYYNDGVNSPCSGGGHGGIGGLGSSTNAVAGTYYGSQTAPVEFGSGGGNFAPNSIGGGGGGSIQINVGGNLQVDGTLSARGGNGSGTGGGGGAGGSVYLIANTVSGGGAIAASGGNGAGNIGGGGGGGRIAIITGGPDTFVGAMTAAGGGGVNWGGAGTIYLLQSNPSSFQLILDNAGHLGAGTPLQTAGSASLIVQNGAAGTANSAVTFASLLVTSNAWLTALTRSTSESFTINGNATFQAGGGFLADSDGAGSGAGSTPGASQNSYPYPAGGGGHGGAGGNSFSNSAAGGNISSDSIATPGTTYVAGGGGGYQPYSVGGNAGGYVRLTVGGTLQLDGLITANGGNGSGLGGGGGAGGGIYLTTGTFAGGGAVSANGGNGANSLGGGGGGGMIAIYFNSKSFTGTLSAFGGNGANWGGAGTIYTKTNSANTGQFIVDNAGHVGAGSAIITSPTTDVTLRNGGYSYFSGSTTFGNIVIGSNAWLVVSNVSPITSIVTINAASVAIQPGGGINGDASGYRANSGNGPGGYNGSSPYFPCGGGGHGGYGANSYFVGIYANGGNAGYDNPASPSIPGSSGGTYSTYSLGGNGGGAIQMTVSGKLQVDGSLSANGGNGSGLGGGGGSGGALNLHVGGLAGAGNISANGGNGVAAIGGGGGGGVIAITLNSNLFSGTLSAYGGAGAGYGGAGTVYTKSNFLNQGTVVVDNASHLGTNTPLLSAGVNNNNVILRNGATAVQFYPSQTYFSLLITSNAWLVPGTSYPGTVNLTVTGNATIQSGGGILTDATGNTQNTGTGHGNSASLSPWYPCSGAGHGGYGANPFTNSSASVTSGGVTFDSTTTPATAGSGGGGYSTYSIGGAGGGYINLNVNGTLQLDGTITANGGNGSGTGGGGGSGGSIHLAPGSLVGAGTITANGGNGALSYGGGGGGGRIAINFNTKTFTGTVSAYAGGGAGYGGAGTIYTKTNSATYGQLVLDNANRAGTNTSFDFIPMDVTVQNQAIGLMPLSGSWTANKLLIRTNGTLTTLSTTGSRILIANTITVDPGGILSVDGAGFGAQTGAGSGYPGSTVRGGGSYGGYGGGNLSFGGAAYGSILAPVSAGSGGGSLNSGPPYSYGGAGGGALQLAANTLTVNGRLSANGQNGGPNSGGGSGGSLYLATITNLTGSGVISANGGSTTGAAGGGGGGRIAIFCNSNNFTGRLSAYGGNGLYPGGAGTVYTAVGNNFSAQSLLVDNGGINGTNTPLGGILALPSTPFNLTLAGGAVTVPLTPFPLLSNLTVNAGSTLTVTGAPGSLSLAVLKNFNLAGSLLLDNDGYPISAGPGAGGSVASAGAGGGYGGAGGNSASGASGGPANGLGLMAQPVSWGSGGGFGANTGSGGSEGGGAVQVKVGGTLNLAGSISANGDYGWQDSSGGGAGGSIWITANTLTGSGNLSAAGGSGDLYNGGGGGGGRIAIYAPTNLFTGTTNVSGGNGFAPGQSGTLYLSSVLGGFQISFQSPGGSVSTTVSAVDLVFNEIIDPTTVSSANFTVTTPAGMLPPSAVNAALLNATTVELSFPVQSAPGNYTIQAGQAIADIFGVTPAQIYNGGFTLIWPVISGAVTDTNGVPVAGVLLQPDGGLNGTNTDPSGNYSLVVPPGWTGTVTPSFGSSMFVPGSQSYTNIPGSLTNQNYLMVATIAPSLAASLNGTNLLLNWSGLAGVTYQIGWSTNLVDWQPFGTVIPGTNGPMQIALPLTTDPADYFRLGASD